MLDRALKMSLTVVAISFFAAGVIARGLPQGAGYQVVKVCSLLSLAEIKKLAPWEPMLDQFAKPEEEPIGTTGSSCNYPTVFIQVMAFRQSFIDTLRKNGIPLESVSGVGDEAYVRNNRDNYAELIGKVGPHSFTVQLSIGRNKTFQSEKPALIAIGKAYAAKLR